MYRIIAIVISMGFGYWSGMTFGKPGIIIGALGGIIFGVIGGLLQANRGGF